MDFDEYIAQCLEKQLIERVKKGETLLGPAYQIFSFGKWKLRRESAHYNRIESKMITDKLSNSFDSDCIMVFIDSQELIPLLNRRWYYFTKV